MIDMRQTIARESILTLVGILMFSREENTEHKRERESTLSAAVSIVFFGFILSNLDYFEWQKARRGPTNRTN